MTTFGIMSIAAPPLIALVVGIVVWIENDQMRRQQLAARAIPSGGGMSGTAQTPPSSGDKSGVNGHADSVQATPQDGGIYVTKGVASSGGALAETNKPLIHPAVDGGVRRGSGHFAGGNLLCK